MLNVSLAVFTLASILVLIALVLALGLWMKNIDAIALPGPGLLIGIRFAFFMECLAEIVFILIAAYLVRFLPFARNLIELMGNVGD